MQMMYLQSEIQSLLWLCWRVSYFKRVLTSRSLPANLAFNTRALMLKAEAAAIDGTVCRIKLPTKEEKRK